MVLSACPPPLVCWKVPSPLEAAGRSAFEAVFHREGLKLLGKVADGMSLESIASHLEYSSLMPGPCSDQGVSAGMGWTRIGELSRARIDTAKDSCGPERRWCWSLSMQGTAEIRMLVHNWNAVARHTAWSGQMVAARRVFAKKLHSRCKFEPQTLDSSPGTFCYVSKV